MGQIGKKNIHKVYVSIMFSLSFPKLSLFKKSSSTLTPNSEKLMGVQTEPLQRTFSSTKDLFAYGKKRCMDALNSPSPYEHTVLADIKKNVVVTEFIGDSHSCNINGIENLNFDKENTVLMHGHPVNTPISPADVKVLIDRNVSQVIAFTKNGQFSLVAKSREYPQKTSEEIYKNFRKEHSDLTEGTTLNNVYELYNMATDHVLKKYSPLMNLKYVTNYDYLRNKK